MDICRICERYGTEKCCGKKKCKVESNLNNFEGINPEHREQKLIPDECDVKSFKELNKIKKNIMAFVKEGKNLFLYSNNHGNGKSAWADELLGTYLDKLFDVVYQEYVDFCFSDETSPEDIQTFYWRPEEIKKYFNYVRYHGDRTDICDADKTSCLYDYIERCKHVNILIIDNLDSNRLSDSNRRALVELLNYRLAVGKSTIITSTITPDNISYVCGEQLATILNCYKNIEFKGEDKSFKFNFD